MTAERPSPPRVTIERSGDLWEWLDQHHERDEGVLLVTFKKHVGERYVSREEVLDALVAYGWVDGRRYRLDDDRTMQLISPRRQQRWAATYQRRFDQLDADGRMHAAGRAALARAREAGLVDDHAHVDRLETPDDLAARLAERDAATWWQSAAPSYRRNVLRWVASAKRPATRARRIDTIVEHAARGEKVPNY